MNNFYCFECNKKLTYTNHGFKRCTCECLGINSIIYDSSRVSNELEEIFLEEKNKDIFKINFSENEITFYKSHKIIKFDFCDSLEEKKKIYFKTKENLIFL